MFVNELEKDNPLSLSHFWVGIFLSSHPRGNHKSVGLTWSRMKTIRFLGESPIFAVEAVEAVEDVSRIKL